MSEKLTRRQELFVAEYLVDSNATRAYVAAGYSKVGAKAGASRLLAHPAVEARINETRSSKLGELSIRADRLVAELARVAFFDPRKLFTPDGSLKPVLELDDDAAAALAGVDVFEEFEGRGEKRQASGATTKVKFADKLRALELLGRYLRVFPGKDAPQRIDFTTINLAELTNEQLADLETALSRKYPAGYSVDPEMPAE